MNKGRNNSARDRPCRLVWALGLTILVSWWPAAIAQYVADAESGGLSFKNDFDRLVWEIDGAGRAADEQRLEAILQDLDAQLVEPKPKAENACWQILKATVLVELSRYRDARASLGVLADTCPVWEVLNNLAVLETREGATGRAATLLQEAIKIALGDEKRVPQANRRALQEPTVLPGDSRLPPALLLVGVPAECSLVVAADCDGPPTAPPGPGGAAAEDTGAASEETAADASAGTVAAGAAGDAGAERPATPETPESTVEEMPPEDEADSAMAAVTSTIESWRAAWEAREIAAYVDLYVDKDRVPAGRVYHIGNKDRIVVEILDLEVDEAEPGRYLAEFTQTYCGRFGDGGWYGDSVTKELELVRVDGAWKIDREQAGPAEVRACE